MDGTNGISLDALIRMHRGSFHESELKVADFLLDNVREDMLSMPIVTFADKTGVSEATIIRFCKKIGISGYTELKLRLAREAGGKEANKAAEITDFYINEKDSLEDIPPKILTSIINSLWDTQSVISIAMLRRAIDAVKNARQVAIFGVANSAVIGHDLCCKLMRLGFFCNVYDDSHQQVTAAMALNEHDVAIGISHSGQTRDTVRALALAQRQGAVTVCISNLLNSPLMDVSDIHLLTSAHELSFSSETMVSRMSQMAIIDMLFVGIILTDYNGYAKRLSSLNTEMKDMAFTFGG